MKQSTHKTMLSVCGLQKSVMAVNEEEVKLQFLLCGSCEIVPASYVKLRSYLNIHVSNLADQLNLRTLKVLRNRNKTCPYCYSSWSGGTTSFKLFPSKKSKFSQARNSVDDEKEKKVHLNELRNTLVLKCKVCSKKSSFSLIKKKPVEKVANNKIVELVKKKKKKDKSCGLTINLKRNSIPFAEDTVHKKKKRIGNSQEITPASSLYANSQNSQLKLVKNKFNSFNNNLMLNPYAAQIQRRFSRKKDKKLQRLKKAVKEEKNVTKKTLKDFLTLI